jgi:hypothetical protein
MLLTDTVVNASKSKKSSKKSKTGSYSSKSSKSSSDDGYGETDHYLAATVDTVTWGYYDPNAMPKISMHSGETITVEVITHHSSHDYAKLIRGDPAVEEVFAWKVGETLVEKNEPKVSLPAATTSTYSTLNWLTINIPCVTFHLIL